MTPALNEEILRIKQARENYIKLKKSDIMILQAVADAEYPRLMAEQLILLAKAEIERIEKQYGDCNEMPTQHTALKGAKSLNDWLLND